MRKSAFIRDREFVFLLCAAVLMLLCALPGPLRADDPVSNLRARQEQIRTATADFVQEKHTRLMKKPIRSEGRFYYRKPDSVRWEYRGRTRLQVIFNGKDMWLYYPDLSEADHLSGVSQYSALLQFDVASLSSRYTVTGSRENGAYRLVMVPKSSGPVSRIEMELAEDAGFPRLVKLFDARDDVTLITFRNVKINAEVRDELFRFVPGPGVKVREQSAR